MTVYNPGAAAAAGTTAANDTIYDAKGDLVAGTGSDAAAKVSVGANGLKLKAASAAAAGVKWDCGFSGTLPASPVTGDEYFWEVDATNHVVWYMLYNGTVWLFLGGPPLVNQVDTSETTASASYAALATPGPLIALPGAGGGLYNIGIGCEASVNANGRLAMSYDIGGTGAVDVDRATWLPTVTGFALTLTRFKRQTIATQLTLTAKYKTAAGTATFSNRWMSLLPVQVNPS